MKTPATRRCHPAGFSLIELMITVLVLLIVAAVALPNLMTMATSANLRGAMSGLSSLVQQCRTQAVQQNKFKYVRLHSSDNRTVAYIDDGTSPAGVTAMTNQLWLPRSLAWVAAPTGSSPTPLERANCGASSSANLCTDTASCDIFFTPLGIPAQCSSPASCTTPTAFAYYFNYANSMGSTSWAALCVSPAGRIKSWYWNGDAWKN